MNTQFRFLVLLFFVSIAQVSAQYTEVINANRPGGSQGAFAVGRDVIQLETGIGFGKEEHRLLKTETNALSIDYSIRYGLLKEQLELSLMGEFQSNSVTQTQFEPAKKYKSANFKSNTIGGKYLIYDPYVKIEAKGPNLYSWRANNKFQWEDLIPAISIYAGANIDFGEKNPFIPENQLTISPKFVISTQNNWLGGWVFVTNIIIDRVTTEYPTYGYIITLTHALNQNFSIFVENHGFKSDFYADQLFRGGAAALITKDLQVDLSLTYGLKDTPSVFYGRVGLAYRFDLHSQDDYIEDMVPGRNKKESEDKKKLREKKLETDDENIIE